MTDASRKRLQRVARLLDNAVTFPGAKRFGIGLDGLLGLIPGVGDALGALLSSYIIVEAWRLKVPFSLIFRMTINVALDTLLGAIPIVGDLFDIAWQANQRNVALLERYMDAPRRERRDSMLVSSLVLIVLLAVIGLAVFLAIALVTALLK